MTLLIDGNNLLHRAHWIGQKNPLITSKQQDVSDIFHILRIVKSYIEQFKSNDVYMVWDHKLTWPSTNFRKEAKQIHQVADKPTDLTYKGNRVSNKDVFTHFSTICDLLQALGLKNMFPGVMEADDVISWLVVEGLRGNNSSRVIISNDSDLLQLIDSNTSVYNPLKKQMVTSVNFEEKAGITKDLYLDYKCLIGDSSDNIRGVRGYGHVKAARLLKEGKLNTLNTEQLAVLEMNRRLIDLTKGYLVHEGEVALYQQQLEALKTIRSDLLKFKNYCIEFEFQSILNDFSAWEDIITGLFSPPRILRLKQNNH